MRRRLALLLLGIAGLLGVAELVLQLLPVSTATERQYYVDPLILTYPPGRRFHVATGWDLRNPQTLQANNAGFVAGRDFVPDPRAVALVGDSYVEASMLDRDDRPGEQLQAVLGPQRPVYAMGGPGSALLDYAERIRLAHERWGVRDFVVVMESGDIRQSLCGSGNVHGPCLDATTLEPRLQLQPAPTTLKKLLSHSALMQYLFGQLKLDPSRLAQRMFAMDAPAPGLAQPVPAAVAAQDAAEGKRRDLLVQAVTEAFFARVKPHVEGQLVFVVDGRRSRSALTDPQALRTPLMRERARFIELARAQGATVIDAEPLYLMHVKRSPLSLNVGPYDGHLNRLGVALLMRAAAEALR